MTMTMTMIKGECVCCMMRTVMLMMRRRMRRRKRGGWWWFWWTVKLHLQTCVRGTQRSFLWFDRSPDIFDDLFLFLVIVTIFIKAHFSGHHRSPKQTSDVPVCRRWALTTTRIPCTSPSRKSMSLPWLMSLGETCVIDHAFVSYFSRGLCICLCLFFTFIIAMLNIANYIFPLGVRSLWLPTRSSKTRSGKLLLQFRLGEFTFLLRWRPWRWWLWFWGWRW